ncbi:carotenoid ester lipase precursor [Cerioporus squamosus]|nr:carotenoid ester lipase precursor [Cerioporus squamosus]
MLVRQLLLLLSVVGTAFAVPTEKRASPTVQLDQGTFVGTSNGVANKFLGIPFGKAPVGDLRFNLPVAVDPYNGTHTATSYGPACPQQAFDFPELSGLAEDTVDFIVNSIFQIIEPSAEDCLSVNVVVPAGTKPDAKLPVAVVSGFELGGTSMYDGGVIVKRSIELGEPVVYVSMNYRKEVKDAGVGNLGLQDQRLALRWVQKYISAFGEIRRRWGESAGAISVALQMLTNGGNTEGLFRGGSCNPGDYDRLVAETGCSGAADTLQCLRQVPFQTLKAAVDKSPGIFSPQSLKLTWLPRADGKFLPDAPQKLVQQGSVASIPFVTGDCDDEGTLFSLSTLNITTEAGLRDYIVSNYIPDISQSDLDQLLKVYPADITQGSPFNTSIANALTPEFKRLAAMQGDLVFQAPRRFFLQNRSSKQSTWSFCSSALGSAHGTDILNVYGGGDMTDYLVNFVNNLDPNGKTGISWPKYTTASPKLLTFLDGVTPLTITNDDYRVDAFNLVTKLSLEFQL